MNRTTRIELSKENFKFSSGHFTIFSATERENIHGHNFTATVAFDAPIHANGMVFDYTLAKRHIESICASLHECFLVPAQSPYLRIEESGGYVTLHFAQEKIPFLPRDVKLLPIENVTVEELSSYFLQEFVQEFVKKGGHGISFVEVKIFSAPGQSANAVWAVNHE